MRKNRPAWSSFSYQIGPIWFITVPLLPTGRNAVIAASSSDVSPVLHISAIRARYVKVPMRFPLGTSAARMTAAPLLLVDLETKEGVVGRSYLFCYRESGAKAIAEIMKEAAELIAGMPVAPAKLNELLGRRYA